MPPIRLTDRLVFKTPNLEATLAFFQRITTSDLLLGARFRYGLFLNGKGKILFDAFFLLQESEIFIDCNQELAEDLLKYVRVLRMRLPLDIELTDLQVFADFSGLSVEGPMTFQDPRSKKLGMRIYSSTLAGEEGASLDEYHVKRIESLVPDIAYDGKGRFPKALGLYELNALSLNKGCYIGQESVNFLSRTPNSKELVALDVQKEQNGVISNRDFGGKVLSLRSIS